VLGVDRVVLHSRVEPQPVPLLAVVERPLERARAGLAAAPAATTAATTRRLVAVPVLVGLPLARLGLRGGLRGLGFGLGLGGLRRFQLGGDQRVILRAQVDLVIEVDAVVGVVGGEVVLTLEGRDLLR